MSTHPICRNGDLKKTGQHRFKCLVCGAIWSLRWYPSGIDDAQPILAAIYKNGVVLKSAAAQPARGFKRV